MRNKQVYYGWVVVAATCVIFTVAWVIPASFAIFFKPLQDALGWSRATVSWAMTAQVATYALFMVPTGWAIDRFNTRNLHFAAGLLVGVPLVLCSRISQPWELYLLWGLPVGIGLSICGPATMALLTRWFTERRGVALGVASAGVGLGGLIGPPVANALIMAYGWRDSFTILGIASGLIIMACAYYVRGPARNETSPGSRDADPGNRLKRPSLARGMTFQQAIRTRGMLLLVLAQIPTAFALRVVQVHVAPHAIDLGISPAVAALVVSTIGCFSIVGRVTLGLAQDRVGAQRVRIICLSTQAIAMLALPFVATDAMFFAYAMLFGLTWGGDVPQVATLAAQCFGVASIGVTYGLMMGIGNLAGALGPLVAGYVFDVTGSYTTVFLAAGGGLLLAVLCVSQLRLPR